MPTNVVDDAMTADLRARGSIPRWGTYTRGTGTQYGVSAVRCIDHSEFDALGFAVQRATDPPGERCAAPIVGRPCEECGTDC